MEYIDRRMGEGWRTVECCSGSCEHWGTRGATRSWRSMCGHGGEAASPRRQCALTLRPGNGLEPVRDGDFLGAGSNSPGNGLLRAGAEPLGGRASETAGGANLHSVHLPTRGIPTAGSCSLEMSTAPARRSPAGWKCPLRRPLGPVQLASTSAEWVQRSPRCSTGWTKSVRHSGVRKVKGEIR